MKQEEENRKILSMELVEVGKKFLYLLYNLYYSKMKPRRKTLVTPLDRDILPKSTILSNYNINVVLCEEKERKSEVIESPEEASDSKQLSLWPV